MPDPNVTIDRKGVCLSSSQLSYKEGKIIFELALITWIEPVVLSFNSSQYYDFELKDPSGNSYWKWSDGQVFTPEMQLLAMVPQEPQGFYVELDKLPTPDPKPKYVTLHGVLLSAEMAFKGSLKIDLE